MVSKTVAAVKQVCFLLVYTTVFMVGHSQNETKKWRFGTDAGLDFSTNPLTNISMSTSLHIGAGTSVCDANGNLLFYSNGATVWNSNNTVMANGSGLSGHWGYSNVMIEKLPGSANLFYVLYVNYASSSNQGLYYSIVDMSLASGQGSVTVKDVPLFQGALCSKLTATRHCNGNDYWIVIKDCSNSNTLIWNGIYSFRSFLLSSAGISTLAAVSTHTYVQTAQYAHANKNGQMKISPNGKKLACANYGFVGPYDSNAGSFELYDFDNSTGLVSNFLPLYTASTPGNGNSNCSGYGVAFSPDCSKLYGTLANNYLYSNGSVLQWDLCPGTNSGIAASQTSVGVSTHSTINGFGHMQLGPDGKIYIAAYIPPFNSLSCINNPNAYGTASGFSLSSLSLSPGSAQTYLPNFTGSRLFLAGSVPAYSLSLVSGTVGCQSMQFQSPIPVGGTYGNCPANTYTVQNLEWDFGDPASGSTNNNSTLANPMHTYSALGVYTIKLRLDFGCGGGVNVLTQTINVSNASMGTLNYSGTLPCYGVSTGTATYANTQGNNLSYLWTNGTTVHTSSTVTNLGAGTWTSQITNTQNGCQSNTVFTIVQPQQLTLGLSSPGICQNDVLTLNANGGTGALTYNWSNGNVNSSGTSTLLGVNTITVTDANNCSLVETFTVYPKPILTVTDPTICVGGFAFINVPGATNYTWSGGQVVSPPVTTIYTVTGETNGCSTSTPVTVVVNPLPNVTTSTSFTSVCSGHTLALSASGATSYTWSTGVTSANIVYSNPIPGFYALTILGKSAASCTNTANMTVHVKDCATGLNETRSNDHLSIYPNPTSGELMIETGNADIHLFNALGQFLLTKRVIGKEKLVIEDAGVYFLRLGSKTSGTTHKIIVTH